jgi:phospholipase/carboxylesterase
LFVIDLDHHQDQPPVRRGVALADASALVILVHGRGDAALGILGLTEFLPTDRVSVVAPRARAATWYPHSFLAPFDHNEPGLSSGIEVLRRLVDEAEAAGVSPERVCIVGFSQGGCLASEFVARNTRAYGGLCVLSGGLIGNGEIDGARAPHDKRFEYGGSLAATPVFMGCSDVDPHIPLSRFEETVDVFNQLGAKVTDRIYPGMGHTIIEDEIVALQEMVDGLMDGARGR